MWEVFTEGRMPFENKSNAEVVDEISRGERLYRPSHASPVVFQVMYSCWHEVRPNRVYLCCFHHCDRRISSFQSKLFHQVSFYVKYCKQLCILWHYNVLGLDEVDEEFPQEGSGS